MRILDIGIGKHPAILNGLQLGNNDLYIGLDSGYLPDDPWQNQFSLEDVLGCLLKARERAKGSQAFFLAASGIALPFRGESFGRVLLGNLLGSGISDSNKNQLAKEAARVLEKTGRLVIAETISPFPYDQLSAVLARVGISTGTVFKPGSEGYTSTVKEYGINYAQLRLSPALIEEHPHLNTDYIAICALE